MDDSNVSYIKFIVSSEVVLKKDEEHLLVIEQRNNEKIRQNVGINYPKTPGLYKIEVKVY